MRIKPLFFAIIILFVPQNIFAVEYFGSYESRLGILSDNKFPVAESPRKPALNETHWWDIKYIGEASGSHLSLEFEDSYSHKSRLGARFENGFDVGVSYSQLWNTSKTNNPDAFADTILLDTGYQWYADIPFDSAKAKGWGTSNYNFWNVDLETGYTFNFPSSPSLPNATLRITSGIRYAEYDQNYHEVRTNEMFGFYNDGTRRFYSERNLDLDIKGFGPRMGLAFNLPTGFLNIVGSINYSILFSKRNVKDIASGIEISWAGPPWNGIGNGNTLTEGVPTLVNDSGYQEKKKNITIHNLELEGGIEYVLKLWEKSSMIFTLGYRYDKHFNAMTTCGHSKVINPEDRYFGKCFLHVHEGATNDSDDKGHAAHHESEDFISHGPFVRTTIRF